MQPYLGLSIGYPAGYLTKEDALKVESYKPIGDNSYIESYCIEDVDVDSWQEAVFFTIDTIGKEDLAFIDSAMPDQLEKIGRLLEPPPISPEVLEEYRRVFVDIIGATSFQEDKVGWYYHVSEG